LVGYTSIDELYKKVRYPTYIEIFTLPIFSHCNLYKKRKINTRGQGTHKTYAFHFRIDPDQIIIWSDDKLDDSGTITCLINNGEEAYIAKGEKFPDFGNTMPRYHMDKYIQSIKLELDQNQVFKFAKYKYTIKVIPSND